MKFLDPAMATSSTWLQANKTGAAVRVSSAQFFSGTDVKANAELCVGYMKKAKEGGAQLVVFPENSNRDRDYFKDGKPCRDTCWERCETLDGEFLSIIRAEAKRLGIYVAVGVDIRGDAKPTVHICSVLIGRDGSTVGVTRKTVLWDYEYTLFEAGAEDHKVYETDIGRLGILLCADGILPETARCLTMLGAQVLVNSLNSRGPDEVRMHIPCRAMENGVWHVSSNTVGNPNNVGLLWPWTGGSQVVAPDGTILAVASEEKEEQIFGDIYPEAAGACNSLAAVAPNIMKWRRPELYKDLLLPLDACPAAKLGMLGPCSFKDGDPVSSESVSLAVMQLSRHHTRKFVEWAVERQVDYAGRRGAHLGVLPELFCFNRDELQAMGSKPTEAAAYSATILSLLCAAAKKHSIWLCFSLVEEASGKFYHTAYLADKKGEVHGKYRKAHPSGSDAAWATPGDDLSPVFDTGSVASGGVGRVAMMIGHEVWVPEVMRCLTRRGAETVLHPCDWDRKEAAHVVASERVSENKTHLVSVARMDNVAEVGSQVTFAGEFIGGEPIPLMRYASAQWTRYGVEEQPLFQLKRREPYCKMMGFHLCVLGKRNPSLYKMLCETGFPKASIDNKADAQPVASPPTGMGYKKGGRDFTQNDTRTSKRLKYDYTSKEKEYTNGIVAPNRWTSFKGHLSGRDIPIPDVNSGYPKCKLGPVGNDTPGDAIWYDVSKGGERDVLSHVRKFMVVVPSTNTTVEADYWRMLHSNPALDGIGFHAAPILISAPKLASDADMLEFLKQFRKEIMYTIDCGMTAEPEYVVMGMSLETFFGGWEGNNELRGEIKDQCGLEVATGAEACKLACEKLKAKKIAVITPYQEIGDKNCVKFFNEIGLEVLDIHGLKCGSATDIAHVTEEMCEPVLRKLAAIPGVDAIVQCGTNLSLIRLMDRLEKELNVSMVPINAATVWFALREHGVTAPIYESCRFCRDF